ncbi:hypothetical protein [Streptomyces sp. S.PNR 29]|uniref:hypothetical protein n=1 Tax=Streptomyces sp. S.PNR 29 TaxID=2973805 RepID=UPI0025B0AED2|nr:hypothetical protein [Streptomyces sp. S.PNR 29]MDN0197643.1 hypothetical protein [Streptomyces sp. S.PNR 29]
MNAGWCSRAIRAAVFAAVCVLLAALGHVMMSGAHVPGRTLAAGLGVTGVVGWALAGRERGLPLIVSVVVVAQTLLHSAFSFAQSMPAGTMATGGMSHDMGAMSSGSRHMHHSMESMDSTGSMDSMDVGYAGTGGFSSFGMFGAHLLAALLCGLWLAYGERAAFRILRAVAGRLAAPLRLLLALPAPPSRPRLPLRRRGSARAPRLLLLVHSIISRGPPVGTAVA